MRIIFLLFGLLTGFVCFSQPYKNIFLGADKYNFYQLPGAKEKVKGIPHVEVFMAISNEGYGDTIFIVGIYPDMKKKTEKQALLGIGYGDFILFNPAKMYEDPWYKNDTIFVTSQMPFKATNVTLRFVFSEKTRMFEPVQYTIEDPSWEKLQLADSLLAKGKIAEAIDQYLQIEYPASYMNEYAKGKEIMQKAHEIAMACFHRQDYKNAAGIIDTALTFWWVNDMYINFSTEKEFTGYLVDEYGEKWTMEDAKLWLGDYGLFLYKAGLLERSIEINSYINTILPSVAGPYLQLGDSYFDKGDKEKAKEAYKKYAGLMKEQKREKDIPKRVKERMK